MKELNSKIITGLVTIAVSIFLIATGWLFKTVHGLEIKMVKMDAKIDMLVENKKVSVK